MKRKEPKPPHLPEVSVHIASDRNRRKPKTVKQRAMHVLAKSDGVRVAICDKHGVLQVGCELQVDDGVAYLKGWKMGGGTPSINYVLTIKLDDIDQGSMIDNVTDEEIEQAMSHMALMVPTVADAGYNHDAHLRSIALPLSTMLRQLGTDVMPERLIRLYNERFTPPQKETT